MKRKLLFAMLCIVSALGLRAQTWTAASVAEGDYYLYNVGSGQFFTKGNGWGTQASITSEVTISASLGKALKVQLVAVGDDYQIRTDVNGAGNGLEHLDGGTLYTDQSRGKQSSWTFTQVATDNGPVYSIVSKDNHGGGAGAYASANDENTVVGPAADASSPYAQWKLLAVTGDVNKMIADFRYADIKATAKAIAPSIDTSTADSQLSLASTADEVNAAITTLRTALGSAIASNVNTVIDLTPAYVDNPTPTSNADFWTVTDGNGDAASVGAFDAANNNAEFWNKSGYSIKQTLATLPVGYYTLTAVAITRDGMQGILSANENTMNIVTQPRTVLNNRTDCKNYFDAGNGVNELYFNLPSAQTVTIGLTADNTTADHWTVWRGFKVEYLGTNPVAYFQGKLAEVVEAAENHAATLAIPVAALNDYKAKIAAAKADNSTPEKCQAGMKAIADATKAADILAAPYARYNTVKTAVLAISSEISTATADAMFDGLTTVEAIEAATESAVAKLRTDFLTQLPSLSVPSDPGYIDVTDVMVDNAGVHTNTNYWTTANVSETGGSVGVCNYGECEFYQRNFKFYQTLAMNVGTWEFGVTGFHRAGNHSTYFYAGEDKILIPGVESSIVNDMAGAKTYFDNGNGQVSLKFIIEDVQDVEIGIDNQDTETDKWTIFRDFTLKYYGPVDYTVYQERWAADVEEAANEAYQNVTGKERDDVNAAIADAPVDGVSKKADYLAKIEALEGALTALKTAAPIYDKYLAYKAETVALWGNDLGVAAPTTAEEAEKAVQELNIAQYNKVANEYSYSLNGLIGDFGSWTGTATVAGAAATPNYLDWEHWSGQQHAYYEQASNGWGNANGWTIQYEKVCKLPAGNYVLKVAARSSAGTTSKVSCSAIETTIALPCAGNNTRGINTSGEASWSDDDTFAHTGSYTDNPPSVGGTGAGWQWRFLPFTLSEETEVTMTFYAEASTQYQWMSISDGELLSAARVSEQVAFGESKNNTVKDINIADITMSRKIVNGYNTVVLPFSLTANQVTETFGTGSVVYNYSENSADAEKATINFKRGDGSITANVPVLVKATEESTSQWFYGVKIETGTPKVEGKNIDFVGTYSPVTVAADNYFIKGDKLYKSEGKTSIKAFRAYLQPKVAGVRAELFIDGVATAIEAIDADNSVQSGAVYNLAGQRVQKAQRGLYIVNGKKVVIK